MSAFATVLDPRYRCSEFLFPDRAFLEASCQQWIEEDLRKFALHEESEQNQASTMEVGAPEEENALTETPITENEDSVPVKRSKASFLDGIDFGSAGQQTATENTEKQRLFGRLGFM